MLVFLKLKLNANSNFFKLLSGLFEFQTNFGFSTSSFRFTVVFLISKPLFGVIQ